MSSGPLFAEWRSAWRGPPGWNGAEIKTRIFRSCLKLRQLRHDLRDDALGWTQMERESGWPSCGPIIESHAGRLWAARNPDRGATMEIELPVQDDAGSRN